MSSGVPTGLFNISLDSVAREYFKTNRTRGGPIQSSSIGAILCEVLEAFLIAPKLVFEVDAANAVLPLLMNILGQKRVQGLLEDGSIEFMLSPARSALILGLIRGTEEGDSLGSTVEAAGLNDPEASCKAGLTWAQALKPADRRRITWLATNRTTLVASSIQDEAWRVAQGALAGDGVSGKVSLQQLIATATKFFEASVLVERGLDLCEGRETWFQMTQSLSKNRYAGPLKAQEVMLRCEMLPSVRELLMEKLLEPEDVIKLRNHPTTRGFREWLWVSPELESTRPARDAFSALLSEAANLSALGAAAFKRVAISSIAIAEVHPAGSESISHPAVGGTFSYSDALSRAIKSGWAPRHFGYLAD